jgi:hypothetical protein
MLITKLGFLTITITINTPHANEDHESNIQEALSPFDTIDRIELNALFIQTEHDEIEHINCIP